MEQCGFVGNINLNATSGALTTDALLPGPACWRPGTSWPNYTTWYRFGCAMAHYALGGKLFAARTPAGLPEHHVGREH